MGRLWFSQPSPFRKEYDEAEHSQSIFFNDILLAIVYFNNLDYKIYEEAVYNIKSIQTKQLFYKEFSELLTSFHDSEEPCFYTNLVFNGAFDLNNDFDSFIKENEELAIKVYNALYYVNSEIWFDSRKKYIMHLSSCFDNPIDEGLETVGALTINSTNNEIIKIIDSMHEMTIYDIDKLNKCLDGIREGLFEDVENLTYYNLEEVIKMIKIGQED